MVEKFLSKIVTKMSWQNESIGWFCIFSGQKTVHVYLTERPTTDTNQDKQNGTSLKKTLMKFADAFEDGEFQFSIQGHLIQLDKMFMCKDINCEETYLHRNATYPVIPRSQEEQEHEKPKPNFAIMEFGLFVGIIVAILFVLCFVRWLCKVFNKQRDTKHSNMVKNKDKHRRKIVKNKIGKDTMKVSIIHEKIQAFYRISGKQGENRPGFLNLFKSEVKYRIMEE
ncbi:uncharacterized protein LOC134701981 [Mytilus trossulus]|uniref:uncharacterized protein LOC134701981 n=1 Tax=Mytilus trossulus TaxID=6551 RepID=UPI0030056EDE